jgi:hypothetical protein
MDSCPILVADQDRVNRSPGYEHWVPDWIDVSSISILSADLNRLLSVSQTNPYAASGQYLAALESFRSLWVPRLPLIRYESVVIRTKSFSFGKSVLRIVPSIAYSFDQAVEIINRACRERVHAFECEDEQTVALSAVELTTRLFRKLDRRILLVRRLVHRSLARFCAFSWSRRLWYLLHGSHPPKTECRPAFGCA